MKTKHLEKKIGPLSVNGKTYCFLTRCYRLLFFFYLSKYFFFLTDQTYLLGLVDGCFPHKTFILFLFTLKYVFKFRNRFLCPILFKIHQEICESWCMFTVIIPNLMFYIFWSLCGQCDVQFPDEDILARYNSLCYEIIEPREGHMNMKYKFMIEWGIINIKT